MVIPRMEVVPIGAFEFLLALVEVLVLIEFRSLEGVKREAERVVVITIFSLSSFFA